jgi:hypothetical protein
MSNGLRNVRVLQHYIVLCSTISKLITAEIQFLTGARAVRAQDPGFLFIIDERMQH